MNTTISTTSSEGGTHDPKNASKCGCGKGLCDADGGLNGGATGAVGATRALRVKVEAIARSLVFEVRHGEAPPWWAGLAFEDPCRRSRWCAPVPVSFALRVGWLVFQWARFPFRESLVVQRERDLVARDAALDDRITVLHRAEDKLDEWEREIDEARAGCSIGGVK